MLHDLINTGGPPVRFLFALTLPVAAVTLLHALMARTWSRWLAAGGIAMVLVVAIWGTLRARQFADETSELVDPAEVAEVRAQGYAEAKRPIEVGGVLAGVFLVPFAIGEVRKRRRSVTARA